MATSLGSGRVPVSADDVTVEVQGIAAWAVAYNAAQLVQAYNAATTPATEVTALRDLYAVFVTEAQPTWDFVDHLGPIAPTTAGMWRVPLPVALGLVAAWIATLPGPPEPSAVDEKVPPGPARDVLNRELRKRKR